ncbi:MAG: hypothetical protein ACREQ9_23145 [Candidatus Binatia bacterium]
MLDQRLALEKYRRQVATYDDSVRFSSLRRRLVDRLSLRRARELAGEEI